MPAMRAIAASALPLLVPRIPAADDPHDALATDDAAILAHRLDAGSNLHAEAPLSFMSLPDRAPAPSFGAQLKRITITIAGR